MMVSSNLTPHDSINMKTSTLVIYLIIAQSLLSLVRADMVLTQHTFAGAAKTPAVTTMSIKGDKCAQITTLHPP
jgi:hypothetical protein